MEDLRLSTEHTHEQPRVSKGQAFNERTDCSSIFEKRQRGKLLWQLTPIVKCQYFLPNAMIFVGDGDCKSNSPYHPAHSHFLHSAQKQHGSGRENNWVYKAERAMQLWR